MKLLETEIVRIGGHAVTVATVLGAVVGALAVLVFADICARTVTRLLRRRNVASGAGFAVGRLVRYAASFIGVLVLLSSIGVDLGAVFAASTVILVGIGLGLQRIAQDFLAGIVLLVERPVAQGDFVRVGDITGTVEYIGARATRIVTRERLTLIVPNAQLTSSSVVNYSRPSETFRHSIRFGVAYDSDVDKLRRVCLAVAESHAQVLAEPAPHLFFDAFGDSALEFSLAVWMDDPKADVRVGSELRYALLRTFREEGIAVPFPQLDLHVRDQPDTPSGVERSMVLTKGGEVEDGR